MRRSPVLPLICLILSSVLTASIAIGQRTQPQTSNEAAQPPATVSSPGPLRFAQITDVHLFDAGYKCSGSFVEREYQENMNALRWSIDEINRHWNSGEKINFVVFTGDLGVLNLAGTPVTRTPPDPGSACAEENAPTTSYGPIAQMDFTTAETLLAKLLDYLPQGVPVYLLPGNNDLTDEDPGTISRYEQFAAGLRTMTHGRVVNLNNQNAKEEGYTLVGLTSAGFKPQSYTDTAANGATVSESALLHTGSVSVGSQSFYCNELNDNGTGSRAGEKAKAIQTFVGLVSGTGPYLVFTHEPDLQDPYRNLDSTPATGGSCVYRSTWLLTQGARSQWLANGLNNSKILGIFAGHFHSSNLSVYGGPKINDAVAAIDKPSLATGFIPTYIAPPLAIKLQWASFPNTARGMMFVSIENGRINAQVDPYWPNQALDCCGTGKPSLLALIIKVFRSYPNAAFWMAAFFTLLLAAIILLLASTISPPRTQPGFRFRFTRWVISPFMKLVIEGDTNSYSLSRLQFLLWTAATIYAYTYLWIAHTWVQGLPGLPDIASRFPWEILLSGGTAVATQVSKQAVGTKGGGPLTPQLSDLLSAGGVVSPGRIQFLSWTLVAIAAYLSSILASDPCTVHLLPEIPDRLLEISGISALTYLGARAVSPPGPLLNLAEFTSSSGSGNSPATGGGSEGQKPPTPTAPAPASPITGTLVLVGQYLSKNALLKLYRPVSEISIDQKDLGNPGNNKANGENTVEDLDFKFPTPPFSVLSKYQQSDNPDFYTRIELTVSASRPLTGCTLRLQNPDGKYAEVELMAKATSPVQ